MSTKRFGATSTGKKVDTFHRCGKLALKPTYEGDPEFLSALLAVFVHGGTVEVRVKGKRRVRLTIQATSTERTLP